MNCCYVFTNRTAFQLFAKTSTTSTFQSANPSSLVSSDILILFSSASLHYLLLPVYFQPSVSTADGCSQFYS